MQHNDEGQMASPENWILKMGALGASSLASDQPQENCVGKLGYYLLGKLAP